MYRTHYSHEGDRRNQAWGIALLLFVAFHTFLILLALTIPYIPSLSVFFLEDTPLATIPHDISNSSVMLDPHDSGRTIEELLHELRAPSTIVPELMPEYKTSLEQTRSEPVQILEAPDTIPAQSLACIDVPPDFIPAKLTPGLGNWGAPPAPTQDHAARDVESTDLLNAPLETLVLETTDTANKTFDPRAEERTPGAQTYPALPEPHTTNALPALRDVPARPDATMGMSEHEQATPLSPGHTVSQKTSDSSSMPNSTVFLVSGIPQQAGQNLAQSHALLSSRELSRQALLNLTKVPHTRHTPENTETTNKRVMRTQSSLTNLPPGFLYSIDRGGTDFAERDGDPNRRPAGIDLAITHYEYRIAWYVQKAGHYASSPSPAWWESDVIAQFRIIHDGNITNLIVQSGGGAERAVEWVRHIMKQAGPLDPIPPELRCSEIDVFLKFHVNAFGALSMEMHLPLREAVH